MKRTISLGNIDYFCEGKSKYKVTADVRLENGNFAASADVFRGKTYVMGGQCIDELANYPELIENPVFVEIKELWENYHLNDMHAGTPEQEEEVRNFLRETKQPYSYQLAVSHLKEVGLYEVPLEKDRETISYRYGSSWLKVELPEEVKEEIEQLLTLPEEELSEFCFKQVAARELLKQSCGYLTVEEAKEKADYAYEFAKEGGFTLDQALVYASEDLRNEIERELE